VLSNEVLLELDPDVLLITDQTAGQIMDNEPYSLTAAGENNQSVMLEVSYLNQAAPRSIVYSTRNLTAQLHPDQYNESDFVTRSEAAASVDDDPATPEFATSDDAAETDDTAETADETDVSAPGFGVVVAVVAIVGAGLVARRRL